MTQPLPSISIITCTWNSAEFLPQTIESVLKQTYSPFEFIFVDGGSTDGTLDLINAVPGNVKVLHNIQGGISNAMNAGLEVATGDVIAHLHSDDFYLNPNVLQEVAQTFNDKAADWLFGSYLNLVDNQLEALNFDIPVYSYPSLMKRNFIPHPATFIKRTLLEKSGFFNTHYRYAMDYDLWLRLGKLSEPVQLDAPLVVFRRHAGSLSTSQPLAGLKEDFGIRMSQSGMSIIERLLHSARYYVRKHRIKKQLRAEA